VLVVVVFVGNHREKATAGKRVSLRRFYNARHHFSRVFLPFVAALFASFELAANIAR